MGELARGSVADRPWGRTFATLGLRGLTGQLTLVSDAKRFVVAFESGAVVAAASPLASDAAVRVALTSHLVSSSQVPEISRRQAAAPERDEIDLIAELARLGPDHALRLRRRVIAQRAARTFSINHGEFVVTDQTELPILPGCELDARAVIYLGARVNLPEQRLSAELDQLGSRFRLKPAHDDDLPQFGFTDLEQPVVERLRDGGTIDEIEEFATSFVDGRTVRAVVYALAVCNACELTPARPAVTPARMSATLPALAPDPAARRSPTLAPPAPVGTALSPAAAPRSGLLATRQVTATAPTMAPSTPTLPAAPRVPAQATGLATGSAAHLPIEDGIDAPTQRDGASPIMRLTLDEAVPRGAASPALRRLVDAAPPHDGQRWDVPTPREGSSPALRVRVEEVPRRGGSSPAPRSPVDKALPHDVSSPAPRRPFDGTEASQPEPVVLRVPSPGPPPRPRRVQRTDSPQAHDVRALIAQRLKLLEQGADHFQLLGVAQDASLDLLRKAYFALARQLHPDRLTALGISDDGKHAQRLFAQINAGFAVLSDEARRADYLDVLSRGGEAAILAEQARTEEVARRILDAEEAFHRGELALKRDQPQAAVPELERAIQLNPDEADYHALLAWSQFCAAPDKKAIAPATRMSLDKAVQRSPKAVTARFYLGRVERMLGRDQEALRHFRNVLAAAPGHAEAAAELRVLEARLAGDDKPGGGLFGRFKR